MREVIYKALVVKDPREQDIIIPVFGTENEVALPVTELFSEQLIGVSFTAARRQSE